MNFSAEIDKAVQKLIISIFIFKIFLTLNTSLSNYSLLHKTKLTATVQSFF